MQEKSSLTIQYWEIFLWNIERKLKVKAHPCPKYHLGAVDDDGNNDGDDDDGDDDDDDNDDSDANYHYYQDYECWVYLPSFT